MHPFWHEHCARRICPPLYRAEPAILAGRQLCERLLEETGVAMLPGGDLGRPAAELTGRIAYVDFDVARALEACGRMPPEANLDADFLRNHCGRVVEAVERPCPWAAR